MLAALVWCSRPPAPALNAGAEILVPQDVLPSSRRSRRRGRRHDRARLWRLPRRQRRPAPKHDITIRGSDRNAVVLDGADTRKNGIVVRADGVALLNMSAHNFLDNAFYWEDANSFRASYLTAWNIRGYGIYVEGGREGTLDHDYVSGAADAAYYLGECNPCHATLEHVIAALSAVGYSGTNATDVVIRDSVWDRNGAGIVPNTYANEALPPEGRTTIVRNTITTAAAQRGRSGPRSPASSASGSRSPAGTTTQLTRIVSRTASATASRSFRPRGT